MCLLSRGAATKKFANGESPSAFPPDGAVDDRSRLVAVLPAAIFDEDELYLALLLAFMKLWLGLMGLLEPRE